MRRLLFRGAAAGVVLGLFLAPPRRPRLPVDFDLSSGMRAAPEPARSSRSERIRRALATIAAGLESGARAATDRARRTAARAYQADGDTLLAGSHLRAAAAGEGEDAARARLELADLARRTGDLGGARVGYLRALLDVDLPRRAREAALRSWAAIERDAGDADVAESLRVVLALDARRATDRVRAWSELVRARRTRAPASAPFVATCLLLACVHREARDDIDDIDDTLRTRLVALVRGAK